MSELLARRTILRLSGGLGVAGLVGLAGVQPASAASTDLPAKIARLVSVANQLNNSNVGYDQDQRWTFLDKANGKIIANKECDCSSSCGGIAWLAGFPVDISGTFYTGNFATKMAAAGFKKIAFTSLSQVGTGDFLVGPGHVIFCIAAGTKWWSAEADENGNASGGKAGDQTGKECYIRKPYMRADGWTYILRPQ